MKPIALPLPREMHAIPPLKSSLLLSFSGSVDCGTIIFCFTANNYL